MHTISLLDIQKSSMGSGALKDGWVTTESDDPQIILQPCGSLRAGWYRCDVEIQADRAIDPQLFFDLGSGFNEIQSVRLRPSTKSSIFSATVKIPSPALSLRLDPMSSNGRYLLASVTLKRLNTQALGLYLCRYGWGVMRDDPVRFARSLPSYLRILAGPNFLRLSDPASRRNRSRSSYKTWISQHDFDEVRDGPEARRLVDASEIRPTISVVMPAYNTPKRFLIEAIESVLGQIYENWELCIADDSSTKPHVRALLSAYASKDARIKVVHRTVNGHISEATNSAFALATGEWIALLDHDDVLRPHALAEVVLEISRHPDAELVYSDEDKIDGHGRRYEPHFKPDYSRELFRSQNYLNHLTVHRADNIRAVGGWRRGFEGSQDYDINLRIIEQIDPRKIRHIPKILYHWRAVSGSTALSGGQKSYAYQAGFRALQEHVTRTGLDATVEEAPGSPFYRLRLSLPDPCPLVSLIIPTKDKLDLLRGCVESIIQKTTYGPYEIVVVDNGSTEAETLAYLQKINKLNNVRVLSWSEPFNYSAINNFAVSHCNGEIVGLINNDVEVISPGWLAEMVSWAARDDIGCVGAKLYYADDTIQHAGVILGIGGVAGHAHLGLPRNALGHFGRAGVVSNFSAVTAACLIVRKSVYVEAGGLDEKNLKVAFNDVDFSLKVRRLGLFNVWTPYAELYHLESASRGPDELGEKRERFLQEASYMINTWRNELAADPYYSPNLTRLRGDFSVADS